MGAKKREIALTTEKGREILHKRELLRGIRDGGGRMGGRLRGDERGEGGINYSEDSHCGQYWR